MRQRPITIVLLVSIATISVAEFVIQTEKPAVSVEVAEATVNILSTCYADRGNAIGIVGTVPDTFFIKLWSRRLVPVVLIDNTRRMVHVEDANELLRWKLQVFMIVGSTGSQVDNQIEQVGNSRWYNHMASFLIPDWSPIMISKPTGIMERLYHLWANNIYNANVVWSNSSARRVEIFGFNPHTTQAPKPWELLTTTPKGSGRVFTVFMRKYRDDEETCENLDFDKTMDLGEDSIKVLELRETNTRKVIERPYRGIAFNRESKTYENVLPTFFRHINATRHTVSTRQCLDPPFSCLILVVRPAFAILESSFYSFPIYYERLSILSQYRGHISQLAKILGVIDSSSQIGVGLVMLITVIFFKFFARQPIVPSILNIFRIISNMGFVNLPQCTPSRIYLSCLLFFVVTMLGIFTGNLASLLTTDIPLRHPNTIEDFVDLGYTIYGHQFFINYFNDTKLRSHVVEIDDPNECGEIVLRDPLNACASLAALINDLSVYYNLRASSLAMSSHPMFPWATILWPFEDTFNKIIMRMDEAGVKVPLDMRVKSQIQDYARSEQMNNDDPKVLTLKNLQFAFIILAIGLSLATISFIVEVAINIKRPKKRLIKLVCRCFNCKNLNFRTKLRQLAKCDKKTLKKRKLAWVK